MDTEKRFKLYFTSEEDATDDDAIEYGHADAVKEWCRLGTRDHKRLATAFDTMKLGDRYQDHMGDTWERIE